MPPPPPRLVGLQPPGSRCTSAAAPLLGRAGWVGGAESILCDYVSMSVTEGFDFGCFPHRRPWAHLPHCKRGLGGGGFGGLGGSGLGGWERRFSSILGPFVRTMSWSWWSYGPFACRFPVASSSLCLIRRPLALDHSLHIAGEEHLPKSACDTDAQHNLPHSRTYSDATSAGPCRMRWQAGEGVRGAKGHVPIAPWLLGLYVRGSCAP